MRQLLLACLLAATAGFSGGAVQAQQVDAANVSFGGLRGDPSLPVTVTAQELTIDETQGTAVFIGNVLVVQGEMRLSAEELRVEYTTDKTKISKLWADGNVLLVNARDAAQSQSAEYDVANGVVTMTRDVVLIQGAATFRAETLVADIATGLGRLEGGVTSTFTPTAPEKADE